ncbi:unnamed protein product [Effrenium voratum]|nr:unnamed protein product [Effrenium voratum]
MWRIVINLRAGCRLQSKKDAVGCARALSQFILHISAHGKFYVEMVSGQAVCQLSRMALGNEDRCVSLCMAMPGEATGRHPNVGAAFCLDAWGAAVALLPRNQSVLH